jgi:uncharacterized membrane protein
MTRSDGMVSSGPHTAAAASLIGGSPHRRSDATRRRVRRGLLALPVGLLLAMPAGPALAQTTGTSGYKQTPPTPKTTSTPKSGTAPSKEATTPATTAPKASTEPASTTPTATAATSPSASKLPFTGLDLRWVVGAGILLLAAGLSIRILQRRQRYGGGR